MLEVVSTVGFEIHCSLTAKANHYGNFHWIDRVQSQTEGVKYHNNSCLAIDIRHGINERAFQLFLDEIEGSLAPRYGEAVGPNPANS